MTVDPVALSPAVAERLRQSDDDRIRRALEAADPLLLRTVAYQLTGDDRLLAMEAATAAVGGVDRIAPPTISDPDEQALIRDVAFDALVAYRDGRAVPPEAPGPDELRDLVELTFGDDVTSAEAPFWWEEFGVDALPRGVDLDDLPAEKRQAFHVVVIGAGMSGISAAVHLGHAGIRYTVIEKNHGVGGTWHENVYPGARVDVASRAYSYTFEPDFRWDDYFATQPELQAYFDYVVDKYGVREHVRFGAEIERAAWDDARQLWRLTVRTADGESQIEANAIISAVGLFNRMRLPDIAGIETFAGVTMHTAAWDTQVDLTGTRVAVIGTGSSGVQIVNPLSETVGQLYVFQRSGTWLANVPNYRHQVPEDEQWLLDCVPYYLNWVRLQQVHAIGDVRTRLLDVDPDWADADTVSEANFKLREGLMRHMQRELASRPDLIDKVTPSYPPLAKRLPKDNGWYEALTMPHVELVTDPIERVTEAGILLSTGREIELDVIVLATGFNAGQYLAPMEIVGRDGRRLEDVWSKDGARAYMGMTIPGFPNLFCMYGPNTNGKAGSPPSWGEMQARYAIEAFRYLIVNDRSSLEVKQEVYDRFNAHLDERLSGLIWMDQRQTSYFRNEHNRVVTNGAWLNAEYATWTRRPEPSDFNIH